MTQNIFTVATNLCRTIALLMIHFPIFDMIYINCPEVYLQQYTLRVSFSTCGRKALELFRQSVHFFEYSILPSKYLSFYFTTAWWSTQSSVFRIFPADSDFASDSRQENVGNFLIASQISYPAVCKTYIADAVTHATEGSRKIPVT